MHDYSRDEKTFAAAIQTALDDWFVAACHGPVYLYYKPYGEEFGVFGESGAPDGWELVTGAQMPRNTDRAGCYQWMRPLVGQVSFYNVK